MLKIIYYNKKNIINFHKKERPQFYLKHTPHYYLKRAFSFIRCSFQLLQDIKKPIKIHKIDVYMHTGDVHMCNDLETYTKDTIKE